MKLIEEVVNSGQGVLVLNGDFVQLPVVDTQSLVTIFLICQ